MARYLYNKTTVKICIFYFRPTCIIRSPATGPLFVVKTVRIIFDTRSIKIPTTNNTTAKFKEVCVKYRNSMLQK